MKHTSQFVRRRKLMTSGLFCLASGVWGWHSEFIANAGENRRNAWLDPSREMLMMRHADAPGFSDPDILRLDDCATQRNLGERGRQQAAETGAWLRSKGIQQMQLWSSPWCRCKDTAMLLGFGEPSVKDFLGSFFRDRQKSDSYTAALTKALQLWFAERPQLPLMLVTHQVNISAYTGKFASSGEIFKVRVESSGRPESLQSLKT